MHLGRASLYITVLWCLGHFFFQRYRNKKCNSPHNQWSNRLDIFLRDSSPFPGTQLSRFEVSQDIYDLAKTENLFQLPLPLSLPFLPQDWDAETDESTCWTRTRVFIQVTTQPTILNQFINKQPVGSDAQLARELYDTQDDPQYKPSKLGQTDVSSSSSSSSSSYSVYNAPITN